MTINKIDDALKLIFYTIFLEGDHIKVTASKYSFPTVCKEDQATDWFNSLQKCLHWNKRQRQKSFAVVESDQNGQKSSPSTPRVNLNMTNGNSAKYSSNGSYSRKNSGPSSTNHSGTSSPQNQKRNEQSSCTDITSDTVFAMFIEDDYRQDSEEEEDYNSHRFFESDEDSSLDSSFSIEDGFSGWTDAEILEARSASQINQEIHHLSISKAL